MDEHAVLIYLKLSDTEFGSPQERAAIHAFSDSLEAIINNAKVGEFDGDEFGEGKCTLFTYGPDADLLFAAIEHDVRTSVLCKGGYVIKRYGAATNRNAKEVRVQL